MVAKGSASGEPMYAKVIRDKEFADRLNKAVDSNSNSPPGHGRQSWVKQQFEQKFSDTISPEGVRKWFAGESRPRPKVMTKLAEILEVDESWLALGISPSKTPMEARRHNALAAGAVNLVAALFQLSGGSIAFPEPGSDKGFDLMVILNGRSHMVEIKYVKDVEKAKISFSQRALEDRMLILVSGSGLKLESYNIYRIPSEVLKKHGQKKGGSVDLAVSLEGNAHAGDDYLPVIRDFANLNGELPDSANEVAA